jgi:DNA-binding MarR family transcriptional regulator
MSTLTTFTPQAIGQTEKALNAMLDRLLAGTGLSEPQWVTLTVTAASGGNVGREELIGRLAGAVKITGAEARARIGALAAAGLVEAGEEAVTLTAAGQDLHTRVRTATVETTERLWGDLPAADLETAGSVLNTVLSRANAELVQH